MDKMVAVNTKQPKEVVAKLEQMVKQSGKSKSQIVRDLITFGEVKTVTNGVELAKTIVHVRNDINTAKLQMAEDLDNLRSMIYKCEGIDEKSQLAKSFINTLDILANNYNTLNRNAEGKISIITRIVCEGK